jgi:hypothetical protein
MDFKELTAREMEDMVKDKTYYLARDGITTKS